ncbi:MAG: NFACT family protein, partial [Oscillospiraceae bacterium]|nr:NFACT family protein [Oscillospiraceae bacterium]
MKITWKVLAAVAEQIKSELPGNHIQKINQISATDILLKFRKSTILISCNPAMPRIHLTTTAFENPDKAPNFCMLLRKHIGSAKLIDIVQPAGERILDFVLQSKNELGDIAPKHLIAEIMGRNSNVILADEHYKILGALRPGGDLTSPRPLITGIKYEFPPKNEKPFECDDVVSNDISAEIESACRGGHRPSSESAIDLFQFAEKKIKALNSKLSKLQTELATAQNRAQDKLFGELLTANIYRFPTTVGVDAHIDPPHGTMPTNMRRGDGPPSPAGDRDGRPYNAHAPHSSVGGTVSGAPHIEKGQPTTVGARLGAPDFVELENYYDNNNTIQIPIDSTLSIAKNAAAYYKTYEKKSRAEKHLTTQITKTIDEISYLESIQISLDLAQNKADYDAIRSE